MMIPSKHTFWLSTLILILIAVLFIPNKSQAQSFDQGVALYEQGNFEEAASIFNNISSAESRLFSGKSYFGLGQYLTAKTYLSQIGDNDPKEVYLEAQYTLAFSDFQLGLFGDALNRLYKLRQQRVKTKVVTNGIQLYNDILSYLTLNQRKTAFQQAAYPQIKFDLVKSAMGTVPLADARILYSQLVKSKIDTSEAEMKKLADVIADSVSYETERIYGSRNNVPNGMIYDIGAALPSSPSNSPELEVAKNLHFGFVMAAEEFNREHTNKKAFIRHKNTVANADSAGNVITDFAWNYHIDAILGPLFSEPAGRMAELAEQYQIPLIAPLANSDKLNIDNPYVYQANPTFTSHGQKMAEYAVNSLDMDTLAVLAEKNTLGEVSAFAFRDKAERLGASVAYFFVEDLKSKGYDLTDYTKYFTADSTKINSFKYHHLDGIYAPFTGQAASTLAELLLVDLKAMGSDLTVLGSQEWGNMQIPEIHRQNQPIYFSESYYMNSKSERLEQFKKQFKKRFDTEASRFAMIGYDAASYLLNTLNKVGNPAYLKDALKTQPRYEGLIGNIFFDGTHINQEVKVFQITENGVMPVLQNP